MNTIANKLNELNALVEKHPTKIPLSETAKFLDMNEEGLKAALMRGNAPFGFAYQKNDGAYRVCVIPTVTFYLWYTNCNARMIMSMDEKMIKHKENES
jgi:hypothetical protein